MALRQSVGTTGITLVPTRNFSARFQGLRMMMMFLCKCNYNCCISKHSSLLPFSSDFEVSILHVFLNEKKNIKKFIKIRFKD